MRSATCKCSKNLLVAFGVYPFFICQQIIKINKYLALKTTIESNGWSVELFAVEVGARGYCSKSVLCCLRKLGFNNTLI